MQLAHGAVVAVVDGEILNLYRNTGTEADLKLAALPAVDPSGDNKSAGSRHQSSSANPDASRLEEDSFAAAAAAMLNKQALENKFDQLVVIAAPKTLGELRKHWHKALEAKLAGELSKDLTGHSVADIEAALGKN
ncbi:host attachment family protein [Polymorphobacter sp.]|uniref:host attachment family protein n=1 Tax=Polymorphobacter sp. TaxID=1909290 RepID=UPI003F6F58DF